MIASSACAVQILLVAFSRRMCCSRVCNASRSAGRPCASLRDANQPPRHVPLEARRAWQKMPRAARQSPAARRIVARCQWRCPRRIPPAGSATSAPANPPPPPPARPPRAPARQTPSVIMDRAVGVRILHQRAENLLAGIETSALFAHDDLDAQRLARVRTTSMFCGWQASDTKNDVALRPLARGTSSSPPPRRWLRPAARRWRCPAPVRSHDHRLEIQQRLQPALRNFRLIRRVGVYQPGFSRMFRWITGGVMQS